MRDEGLRSIDFSTVSRAVKLVYEPDTPYDLKEIIEYVTDMSEGRTDDVLIYEDKRLAHRLKRTETGWRAVDKLMNGVM